jgi:hypothetical protein
VHQRDAKDIFGKFVGWRGSVSERGTAEIEAEILRLLSQRGKGKTICPSEVARAVGNSEKRSTWEPLMEPVREVAKKMVADGKIVIMQRGQVVDGETAKGAIRFRLR